MTDLNDHDAAAIRQIGLGPDNAGPTVAPLEGGEMSEWTPIESAPKTRKAILVYCPDLKNAYEVFWLDVPGYPDEGYWCHFCGTHCELREIPSHWMPLPEPPK